MFNRHLSTILRLNRKMNVKGNVTDMDRLPQHIHVVTTRQQGQNMIRFHMANRTKAVVSTASKIFENHRRRISAQKVRNRLKSFGLHERRPYVGSCITKSDRNRRRRLALVI